MTSPLASLSGYPGRGVVLYRSGERGLCWMYFLTGRSSASKARRFVEGSGSLAVASTAPGVDHDGLRHYVCGSEVGGTGQIVIGNGEHVPQIARSIESGARLLDAVGLLEPEPDPPINTPRIAAVLDEHDAWLVAIRREAGRTERRLEPVDLGPDEGFVVHTYSGSSQSPVGSAPHFRFRAHSERPLPETVWQALHPDHRVMLAAGSGGSVEPTQLLP